jgi:DNA-binding phage protein
MPATPEETWKGSQVGDMLAAQATLQAVPARESLHEGLRELVARVDHGKSAAFARRIGLSKGTVHHWLKEGGIPALPAHLRIASQTGLSLAKLLAGDLANWSPTTEVHQLTFLFPRLGERAARRELDWEQIRAELTAMGKLLVPVSVAEAARCLDVDVRLLYQSANKEARILAERWRQYMRRRGEQSVANAREAIDVACQDIASQGKSINLREVKERVRPEVIGKVRNVIGLVQGARERSEAG